MLTNQDWTSTATALIEGELRRLEVPGALVIVDQRDRDPFAVGIGLADIATGAPMLLDGRVRVASITKSFTATAALCLVDEVVVHLDDPVAEYLPHLPIEASISIRHLLNMTSGIADYAETDGFLDGVAAEPHRVWAPEELVEVAFAQPPVFAAGSSWQYSSTNTILLGLVLEHVTGQQLHAVLRERVFAPLGMHDTSLPLRTENLLPDPHPRGYLPLGPGVPLVDATDWNPSWGWAAGSAVSTVRDLAVWARALATGQLLGKSTRLAQLDWVATGAPFEHGTGTLRYGLGVADFGGLIGHNGQIPGFQAIAVYHPEHETAIVVVTNIMSSPIAVAGGEQPADTIGYALASLIDQEF